MSRIFWNLVPYYHVVIKDRYCYSNYFITEDCDMNYYFKIDNNFNAVSNLFRTIIDPYDSNKIGRRRAFAVFVRLQNGSKWQFIGTRHLGRVPILIMYDG